MPELTDDQKAEARKIFEGQVEGKSACYHCAGLHDPVAKLSSDRQPCPRVKKIEYAPTGQVIAVEYWPNSEGWMANVLFPRDVYDED